MFPRELIEKTAIFLECSLYLESDLGRGETDETVKQQVIRDFVDKQSGGQEDTAQEPLLLTVYRKMDDLLSYCLDYLKNTSDYDAAAREARTWIRLQLMDIFSTELNKVEQDELKSLVGEDYEEELNALREDVLQKRDDLKKIFTALEQDLRVDMDSLRKLQNFLNTPNTMDSDKVDRLALAYINTYNLCLSKIINRNYYHMLDTPPMSSLISLNGDTQTSVEKFISRVLYPYYLTRSGGDIGKERLNQIKELKEASTKFRSRWKNHNDNGNEHIKSLFDQELKIHLYEKSRSFFEQVRDAIGQHSPTSKVSLTISIIIGIGLTSLFFSGPIIMLAGMGGILASGAIGGSLVIATGVALGTWIEKSDIADAYRKGWLTRYLSNVTYRKLTATYVSVMNAITVSRPRQLNIEGDEDRQLAVLNDNLAVTIETVVQNQNSENEKLESIKQSYQTQHQQESLALSSSLIESIGQQSQYLFSENVYSAVKKSTTSLITQIEQQELSKSEHQALFNDAVDMLYKYDYKLLDNQLTQYQQQNVLRDLLQYRNESGATFLHYVVSVWTEWKPISKFLDKYASEDDIFARDHNGHTIAHICLDKNRKTPLKALLNRYPKLLSMRTNDQQSLLQYAIEINWRPGVELIQKKSEKPIKAGLKRDVSHNRNQLPTSYTATTANENSFFHEQVMLGHLSVIDKALTEQSVSVNLQNQSEQTFLHLAVLTNNLEMVKLLLKQPSIRIDVLDNSEQTAYELALMKNNVNIINEIASFRQYKMANIILTEFYKKMGWKAGHDSKTLRVFLGELVALQSFKTYVHGCREISKDNTLSAPQVVTFLDAMYVAFKSFIGKKTKNKKAASKTCTEHVSSSWKLAMQQQLNEVSSNQNHTKKESCFMDAIIYGLTGEYHRAKSIVDGAVVLASEEPGVFEAGVQALAGGVINHVASGTTEAAGIGNVQTDVGTATVSAVVAAKNKAKHKQNIEEKRLFLHAFSQRNAHADLDPRLLKRISKRLMLRFKDQINHILATEQDVRTFANALVERIQQHIYQEGDLTLGEANSATGRKAQDVKRVVHDAYSGADTSSQRLSTYDRAFLAIFRQTNESMPLVMLVDGTEMNVGKLISNTGTKIFNPTSNSWTYLRNSSVERDVLQLGYCFGSDDEPEVRRHISEATLDEELYATAHKDSMSKEIAVANKYHTSYAFWKPKKSQDMSQVISDNQATAKLY